MEATTFSTPAGKSEHVGVALDDVDAVVPSRGGLALCSPKRASLLW